MSADARGDDPYLSFVAARTAALRRTAFLLTGDWHAAEDLTASATLAGYLRRGRIEPTSYEAYVRRVLFTHFLSWRRRNSRRERATDQLPDARVVLDPASSHADAEPVRGALMTLPPRQRAVLVLRYYEDRSEAEIAQLLGISVGSVKTHASRGAAALRDLLATPGVHA